MTPPPLLACPFCGWHAVKTGATRRWARCDNPDGCPGASVSATVEEWNRRARAPAPAEGGKWTPRSETEEMLIAGLAAYQVCKGHHLRVKLAQVWRAMHDAAPPPADNWSRLIAEYESQIGKRFVNHRNERFVFFGLVHADDDYYYGMVDDDGRMHLVSCVGSLEMGGYWPDDAAPAAERGEDQTAPRWMQPFDAADGVPYLSEQAAHPSPREQDRRDAAFELLMIEVRRAARDIPENGSLRAVLHEYDKRERSGG